MDLTLDTRAVQGWVVIRIMGDLDVYSAGQLDRYLAQAAAEMVDRGGAGQRPGRGLVLEMGDVAFIDSAGLGVLVAAYRRLRTAGQGLRLVGISEQLAMMLDVTRLNTVMAVFPDLEQATEPA